MRCRAKNPYIQSTVTRAGKTTMRRSVGWLQESRIVPPSAGAIVKLRHLVNEVDFAAS